MYVHVIQTQRIQTESSVFLMRKAPSIHRCPDVAPQSPNCLLGTQTTHRQTNQGQHTARRTHSPSWPFRTSCCSGAGRALTVGRDWVSGPEPERAKDNKDSKAAVGIQEMRRTSLVLHRRREEGPERHLYTWANIKPKAPQKSFHQHKHQLKRIQHVFARLDNTSQSFKNWLQSF